MASVGFRRGGWELRYRDRDGRQRVERLPGPAGRRPPEAVLDRQADVERELRRGTYVSREEREVTFAVYYERWLASRQISSARAYTDAIRARNHVLPHWGHWPLARIRPSDVDDWIAALSAKMGPHSVRHCYTLFRGPLRRAIKDRIIDDPCIDVPLPKKPDRRKTWDDVLTAAEVDRLVAAITDDDPAYAGLKTNGRYRALVFMGAWLGPRWNEAIGLRRCDLNPLRHELTFGRVVVNQNGSRTYTERFSKTDDCRTVPVPKPVMDELTRHVDEYCPAGDREQFLFLTRNGTHPLRANFTRDAIRPALSRSGLGKHVTWLTLRHTAASLMFDAGLTIFEVQQRLGHKSPAMTAEVYTHLMRERFEEGRQRMEDYMRRQRNGASRRIAGPE
jgi:integrase